MTSPPLSAAYPADRAAGLAGIPQSTLHYWSRKGIWVPSASKSKVKLWSYADILGLRLVDWLRQDKPDVKIPKTPMGKIRHALSSFENFGELIRERSVWVSVDQRGGIVLHSGEDLFVPMADGLLQGLLDTRVNLVAALRGRSGLSAPNLVRPRPTLRIIPGKLSGEPHVQDTRIPTTSLAALGRRGFQAEEVMELYPTLTLRNVREALDLEEQLGRALGPLAA